MTVKIALVTGAGREAGMGFAVARELAAQGFYVVLSARDEGSVEPLAALLRREGHQAGTLRVDLSDPASLREAAGRLDKDFGRLDVLINNAAAMPDFGVTDALDADMDRVRTALEVSVLGPWALVQELLPLLKAAPAARIVNITSQSAQQIATGLDLGAPLRTPAHSMAKYMLNALTGVLGRALADTPILVNAVDPGTTATHPESGDESDKRSATDSARDIVRAATLGPDGPTGQLLKGGHTTT
ncbi:SDR family oxidoreductase (plasmid) [Streptomyces sp. BI20]|uniref:SDR family oxidoreductase n=1 Tax=Streptomyces sp. BI20 TaxID=3403460 RepID=UPI003C769472